MSDRRSPTAILALVLTTALASQALALLKSEQDCLNALSKDAAKLAAVQGKEALGCVKSASKGKLPPGQSADACAVADAKGKVAKAAAKLEADYTKRCVATPPPFGLPPANPTDTIQAAVVDATRSLTADVLGASLSTVTASCVTAVADCKCQQAAQKGAEKLAAVQRKEYLKALKTALALPAAAASDIESSIAATGSAATAKVRDKLALDLSKKCASRNTGVLLAGGCGDAGAGAATARCIDQRLRCRQCLMLNLAGNVAAACDVVDDGVTNASCPRETFNLHSTAEPAQTPGTPAVPVSNPNLTTMFGSSAFSLNNARYTRYRPSATTLQPDAILILIPGFEGGAHDFKIFAENLIPKASTDAGLAVEVWAYDRRSNQLEDTAGLDVAEGMEDPLVALDWLFGGELSLALSPELVAGPNRRAIFHNAQSDVPFMANWTSLTFSRDIDAIVEKARTVAKNQNVFLGGHSAGTGFTARYAATDFDPTGAGPAQPGYAKLRGLVLLEGGGGTTAGTPLTNDTLDRIIAKFDGGLFGAVRDNAGRCVDGVTPCAIATEATDCAGKTPPKCTLPTTAYSVLPGLLNPRILSSAEVVGIQSIADPDTGQNLLRADQGSAGNNAVAKVPDLATLAALGQGTAFGGLGAFLDDDGLVASIASFVATSIGAPGPLLGPLTTWQDVTEGPLPPAVLPDNGPPPTALPAPVWGQEKEVTRLDRMATLFYAGQSNFTDWYYPAAGLGVTSVSGVCTASTCTVGNVGASCSVAADCNQGVNLDSTALSVGRGRRDIENLTQAANVDIPVICFGGSNGLARVPGTFTAFGQSIGVCAAPSCDGTPRVVDAALPNPAFPTLGDVNGGFEAHISEGFAHVDVVTAEDDADNNVLDPLVAFLARNVQ